MSVGSSACSVVWSKIVLNAPCGCGWQELIFSEQTTRQVSNIPDATWNQPWMGANTPVPPPTNCRMYGFRQPPEPSERYSPFMWTPSKASGAVPRLTQSMSFSVRPAGIQGHPGRLPGELFPGLLGAADELRDAGAHYRYSLIPML